MKVLIHYRTPSGVINDWVCDYSRLDHILQVCDHKGFQVIGMEQLS